MESHAERLEAAPPEGETAAVALPVWREVAPAEPWCPPGIAETIPWAGMFVASDAMAASARGPDGWSLAAASRRGRLHAHRGEFREDACRIVTGREYFALLAADGAGSCRLSRIGSEGLTRAMAARLEAELSGGAASLEDAGLGVRVGTALASSVADVARLAADTGSDPRDFRTTLVAGVWIGGPGGERIVAAQVGDGFVAVRRRDGSVARLGAGDASEFSGEVSCFVPDPGAEERARATVVLAAADISALAVATDGVEDPFYPIERHGPLLFSQLEGGVTAAAPNFQRQATQGPVFSAQAESRLLEWLGFERRGENDDRTLLVGWR